MIADNIVQGSPLAVVNDGTQIALFCQRSEGIPRVLAESISGGNIQKRGTNIGAVTGSPIAPIVVHHADRQKVILPLNPGSPLSALKNMWID